MRQAYDYWQDQPGNHRLPRSRIPPLDGEDEGHQKAPREELSTRPPRTRDLGSVPHGDDSHTLSTTRTQSRTDLQSHRHSQMPWMQGWLPRPRTGNAHQTEGWATESPDTLFPSKEKTTQSTLLQEDRHTCHRPAAGAPLQPAPTRDRRVTTATTHSKTQQKLQQEHVWQGKHRKHADRLLATQQLQVPPHSSQLVILVVASICVHTTYMFDSVTFAWPSPVSAEVGRVPKYFAAVGRDYEKFAPGSWFSGCGPVEYSPVPSLFLYLMEAGRVPQYSATAGRDHVPGVVVWWVWSRKIFAPCPRKRGASPNSQSLWAETVKKICAGVVVWWVWSSRRIFAPPVPSLFQYFAEVFPNFRVRLAGTLKNFRRVSWFAKNFVPAVKTPNSSVPEGGVRWLGLVKFRASMPNQEFAAMAQILVRGCGLGVVSRKFCTFPCKNV